MAPIHVGAVAGLDQWARPLWHALPLIEDSRGIACRELPLLGTLVHAGDGIPMGLRPLWGVLRLLLGYRVLLLLNRMGSMLRFMLLQHCLLGDSMLMVYRRALTKVRWGAMLLVMQLLVRQHRNLLSHLLRQLNLMDLLMCLMLHLMGARVTEFILPGMLPAVWHSMHRRCSVTVLTMHGSMLLPRMEGGWLRSCSKEWQRCRLRNNLCLSNWFLIKQL